MIMRIRYIMISYMKMKAKFIDIRMVEFHQPAHNFLPN